VLSRYFSKTINARLNSRRSYAAGDRRAGKNICVMSDRRKPDDKMSFPLRFVVGRRLPVSDAKRNPTSITA
jgi:hypothetical protein